MSGVYQVLVCRGPYCGNQCGSQSLHGALEKLIRERALGDRVVLGWQSCFGRCSRGPNILVRPRPTGVLPLFTESLPMVGPGTALYNRMTEPELPRLLDEHVREGRPCRDLMNRDPFVPVPPGVQRDP